VPTPLWIEADPGMLEQVIMNLCVNARDAMPQGGRVVISATAMPLDKANTSRDSESRPGNFICLAISDTGCGMDTQTLTHIYEPFFTTKEPGKGTGLGLATVYSIVKQHHGWISVHSVVGSGSHFRIFLPAAAEPAVISKPSQEEASIPGGTEGILVVEDDAGFRNKVTMTLKVLGYRVFEATDGPAALAIWEKHASEIALLFTDQVMPGGISGLELCKRLRQSKPELCRIISTGYTTDLTSPEQLSATGIDLLQKPFTSETLAAAVRKCIDRTESLPGDA